MRAFRKKIDLKETPAKKKTEKANPPHESVVIPYTLEIHSESGEQHASAPDTPESLQTEAVIQRHDTPEPKEKAPSEEKASSEKKAPSQEKASSEEVALPEEAGGLPGDCLYTAINQALGNSGNNELLYRKIAFEYTQGLREDNPFFLGTTKQDVLSIIGTPQAWAGNAGDAVPLILAHALGIRLTIVPSAGTSDTYGAEGPEVRVYYHQNHYTSYPVWKHIAAPDVEKSERRQRLSLFASKNPNLLSLPDTFKIKQTANELCLKILRGEGRDITKEESHFLSHLDEQIQSIHRAEALLRMCESHGLQSKKKFRYLSSAVEYMQNNIPDQRHWDGFNTLIQWAYAKQEEFEQRIQDMKNLVDFASPILEESLGTTGSQSPETNDTLYTEIGKLRRLISNSDHISFTDIPAQEEILPLWAQCQDLQRSMRTTAKQRTPDEPASPPETPQAPVFPLELCNNQAFSPTSRSTTTVTRGKGKDKGKTTVKSGLIIGWMKEAGYLDEDVTEVLLDHQRGRTSSKVEKVFVLMYKGSYYVFARGQHVGSYENFEKDEYEVECYLPIPTVKAKGKLELSGNKMFYNGIEL